MGYLGVGRERNLPHNANSMLSALEPQRRGAHGGQRQLDLRPPFLLPPARRKAHRVLPSR